MNPTNRFRCPRCGRTKHVAERRTAVQTWPVGRMGRGSRTQTVVLCRACAGKKAFCKACGSLPHRVEGAVCLTCGLAAAPDKIEREEALTSSPIAACEFA